MNVVDSKVTERLGVIFGSLLVGAVAFIVSFKAGSLLFSYPELGTIGGWLIAPVIGVLFFVYTLHHLERRLFIAKWTLRPRK